MEGRIAEVFICAYCQDPATFIPTPCVEVAFPVDKLKFQQQHNKKGVHRWYIASSPAFIACGVIIIMKMHEKGVVTNAVPPPPPLRDMHL